MKTNWPFKFIIKFISDDELVSNLLVYIKLLSGLKNNFTIGPIITNDDGTIQITSKMMMETIEHSKAEAPMDYSGSLEDCIGLEVVVETLNDLSNQIIRGREFYPDEAAMLEKMMRKCSNSKYLGTKVIFKHPIKELMEINLQKR
jgi:hypothetical protein